MQTYVCAVGAVLTYIIAPELGILMVYICRYTVAPRYSETHYSEKSAIVKGTEGLFLHAGISPSL